MQLPNQHFSATEEDNLPANRITKVPGEVAPLGRLSHEAKAFEKEIRLKSVPELRDLLARQNKIVENKKLLNSLPDKGEKVKMRQQMLEVRILPFLPPSTAVYMRKLSIFFFFFFFFLFFFRRFSLARLLLNQLV